jgi:hypothetical protein
MYPAFDIAITEDVEYSYGDCACSNGHPVFPIIGTIKETER